MRGLGVLEMDVRARGVRIISRRLLSSTGGPSPDPKSRPPPSSSSSTGVGGRTVVKEGGGGKGRGLGKVFPVVFILSSPLPIAFLVYDRSRGKWRRGLRGIGDVGRRGYRRLRVCYFPFSFFFGWVSLWRRVVAVGGSSTSVSVRVSRQGGRTLSWNATVPCTSFGECEE